MTIFAENWSLDIRDLSLSLGGQQLLHGVDLTIPSGQVTALVGESGSGKSLTALALMGLLPGGAKTTGQILAGATDLLALTERRWLNIRGSDIGMIFQEPMTALNPVQTIGHQVAETLRLHGASRGQAARAARDRLDRVGLAHLSLDRYPHELSGGQRQRVSIAMAIARRPRLLIADEPTTALDVTTQAEILALLRDLVATEGMGLLLITHDLGVVARMADTVAVMQNGQIVEADTTEALFRHHAHPYTSALLAASRPPVRAQRMSAGSPVLIARDVLRRYGPVTAVDRVSFQLRRGESLGLVGESGCGKSTLTRALLGLEAVQSGTILLGTRPGGTAMTRQQRAQLSVVFQDPYGSFNPRWTIRRILQEPFHLTGRPKDAETRLTNALCEVGLTPPDLEKYPHEFSGGQRQRIAIARALVTRPDVLVLDEAVSALDVRVRAQILTLLEQLQDRMGLSYLFISHDLSVVRAICDRVMVMRAGKIVETGGIHDVFEAPRHAYTRNLIEAAPTIPDAWIRDARRQRSAR